MVLLCYVFDLDDVLLRTTELLSSSNYQRDMQMLAHTIPLDIQHMDMIYRKYLTYDRSLRNLLLELHGPKFVLTNASRIHANISLQVLGIRNLFIAQQDANHNIPLKPNAVTYRAFQQNTDHYLKNRMHNKHIDIKYIFFDDRLENLIQPHQMGWITVWIHPDAIYTSIQSIPYASYKFINIYEALTYFVQLQ